MCDQNSTNGLKVNGVRHTTKKILHPKDTITIAKRSYVIEYDQPIGKQALEEILEDVEDVMAQPLLEKAGLVRPQRDTEKPKTFRSTTRWEEIVQEEAGE